MNLALNQIPTSINTVEKLAAWSFMLLHRANATLKIIEAPGVTDYVCQIGIIQADDGTQRLIGRVALELEAGYAEAGQKLWTQTKVLSEVAIPSGYLS